MSKITLDTIVSVQNVQKINDNFTKIANEINNKTLSRNPEGEPNFLQAPLDLNNNRLLNVPAPVSDTDVVRKMDVEGIASPDLSSKQDVLVSGVNIKTINNESILGSGNLAVTGSGGGTTDHAALTNRSAADQHPISAITGLQTAIDGKAPVSHTHVIADVTNLQTTLDGKAAVSHTHTISNVTGLQTSLDSKQATLVSGTNIKTINGASVLGSGDLVVSGTGGEVNTASNLGAGTGVFASKLGVDLRFKSLVAGTNVTLSNDANTITINSTASGGTSDHSVLTNRNIADQHPISAITNLQTTLDSKASTSVATTSVAGLMSAADKTKLDGVATGATANSSDATLLNRANHTGTQAISTVTGLQTALDGKQPLDGDLTAIAALSTNGVPKRTAADTWVVLADVKEIVVSTTAPADTTKLWLDIN